jgi:hypothetical protein
VGRVLVDLSRWEPFTSLHSHVGFPEDTTHTHLKRKQQLTRERDTHTHTCGLCFFLIPASPTADSTSVPRCVSPFLLWRSSVDMLYFQGDDSSEHYDRRSSFCTLRLRLYDPRHSFWGRNQYWGCGTVCSFEGRWRQGCRLALKSAESINCMFRKKLIVWRISCAVLACGSKPARDHTVLLVSFSGTRSLRSLDVDESYHSLSGTSLQRL